MPTCSVKYIDYRIRELNLMRIYDIQEAQRSPVEKKKTADKRQNYINARRRIVNRQNKIKAKIEADYYESLKRPVIWRKKRDKEKRLPKKVEELIFEPPVLVASCEINHMIKTPFETVEPEKKNTGSTENTEFVKKLVEMVDWLEKYGTRPPGVKEILFKIVSSPRDSPISKGFEMILDKNPLLAKCWKEYAEDESPNGMRAHKIEHAVAARRTSSKKASSKK